MKHRVKIIRKNIGLTQDELAELAGVSLRMIQYLEKGEKGLSQDMVDVLCEKLRIEPWMLWIDPARVVDEEGMRIISQYKALSDDDRDVVDMVFKKAHKKKK